MKTNWAIFLLGLFLLQCSYKQESDISLDHSLKRLHEEAFASQIIFDEHLIKRLPGPIRGIARIKAANDSLIIGQLYSPSKENLNESFFFIDNCCIGLINPGDGYYVDKLLTLSDTNLATNVFIEFSARDHLNLIQFYTPEGEEDWLNQSTLTVARPFFHFQKSTARDILEFITWMGSVKHGEGMTSYQTIPVKKDLYSYWQDRLEKEGIEWKPPESYLRRCDRRHRCRLSTSW